MDAYPFPWRFYPSRYSEFYLMSQLTEAKVQASILSLLHQFQVDAVAIDAGGRRQRGRIVAAAHARGIQLQGLENIKTGGGVPAGFSDIEATLAPSGRALFIEVKAPMWLGADHRAITQAGRPSKEQLDFLLEKHRRGAIALVAWSVDDVELFLGDRLKENLRALR